jgi:glycosyltransferase involved in cell wall biosynthesis
MRIALVYDCLFPNSIGGAERWYRNVAERLDQSHRVTYLTRRQWGEEGPETGFETVAVGPGGGLYAPSGNRSIGAPLRFGWGVFWHLLRHGSRYDAIHTASFPYFSVLGAWMALRLRRSRAPLIVDWHEFWTDPYWRRYLGPLRGRLGAAIQALCLRAADYNFTFSRMVERRLSERGYAGPVVRLTGEFVEPGGAEAGTAAPSEPPLVVFAGRHIREKRVLLIPPAIAAARTTIPELRCSVLGDGPETDALRSRIAELSLGDAVDLSGRVEPEQVRRAISSAACLLNPSEREGYGLVVVEAASVGTPTVVVAGPENAATELIEPGINGFIAESSDPKEIGRLLVEVVKGARRLRDTTSDWYARNREALSFESSMDRIEATYEELDPTP